MQLLVHSAPWGAGDRNLEEQDLVAVNEKLGQVKQGVSGATVRRE